MATASVSSLSMASAHVLDSSNNRRAFVQGPGMVETLSFVGGGRMPARISSHPYRSDVRSCKPRFSVTSSISNENEAQRAEEFSPEVKSFTFEKKEGSHSGDLMMKKEKALDENRKHMNANSSRQRSDLDSTVLRCRNRRFLLGSMSFTAISAIGGVGFYGIESSERISGASMAKQVGQHLGFGAAIALPTRERDAYDEGKLLEQNRRIQKLNQAPENFPGFVREGFDVKVIIGPEYEKSSSGLIILDIVPGTGENPKDGQQVIFNYIGYNESARRVDSTYLKGEPARTRLGIGGMIPGFEEGLRSMRVGGKRRIVIPPELGPPTGPSTFFSAKQYEVFDVELLSAKDCVRRQIVFYSDVKCE